ncbi:autotransporter assembly complex family protein [Vibrio sp. FNV 38]|nr:autotransporter assembly complex family protein [Vibrio sp. FNV 38]
MFISVMFYLPVHAQKLTIEGLPTDLSQNVLDHMSGIKANDLEHFSHKHLSKIVRQSLQPFGYYQPTVHLDRDNPGNGKIIVEKGNPVRVEKLDILLLGEAQQDEDFLLALEQSELKLGQILKHQQYDNLKTRLRSLALTKGYFDAEFTATKLEVVPSQYKATIVLHFNSGRRYRFGATDVEGSQIREDRVDNLKPFDSGDFFDAQKLNEYQVQLAKAGWFKQLSVKADIDNANTNLELPIEVTVAPSSENIVQVGGGYATDIGLRGSLRWSQPWYNDRGHSFDSEVSLSEPEQLLNLGYKIPNHDVLSDYYAVQFGINHVDYLDTKRFTSDLTFEKHWNLTPDWQSTVYLKYLFEDYTQASDEDSIQFLMPGISFSYLEQKVESTEIRHRHLLSLEYSDPYLFSNSRILRMTGESVMSWNITEKQKFHLRANVGANFTDDLSDIPSSLRFFVGGDGSLRGYDYESISPSDKNGELIGALYMASAGFEYQYNVYGSFWLGTFLDIGDAFDHTPDLKKGTGISVIWDSKLVPIKLDFAYGLDADQGDEFRLHFSLGTQF